MRTPAGDEHTLRPSLRAALTLTTALALTLALAACGDDSDDEESAEESTEEAAPTTTTTQPSATDDDAAAFAIVEDIFHERSELVDDVYRNPELIDEPDSTKLERLRELSTGGMDETVDTLLDEAQDMVDDNHRLEATGRTMSEIGIYGLDSADADTITFEFCHLSDNQRIDANEELVGEPVVFGYYGPGEAERVDGLWKISSVEYWDDYTLDDDDLTPGELQRGACETEFSDLINTAAEGEN